MNLLSKWLLQKALSASLKNLSKEAPHYHEVAEQIEKTRIALLYISGVDPEKIRERETMLLDEQIKAQKLVLRLLQQEINAAKTIQQQINEAKEKANTDPLNSIEL